MKRNDNLLIVIFSVFSTILSSCQRYKALNEFYGDYIFVDDNDNYDPCTLILNKDKSYQIVYQNRTHSGKYTYEKIDNATAFTNRSPIYFGEPNFPSKSSVKSYDLHLYVLDEYDFLPEPLVRFFNQSYVRTKTQYLYIHTFADAATYEEYGRTKRSVGDINKTRIYKEVSYYEDQQAHFDKDGYPIPELNDQRFDFYQITEK